MIIFLDIDGVLNCDSDFSNNTFERNRLIRQGIIVNNDGFKASTVVSVEKLSMFKGFAEEIKADIVLSSTWRLHSDTVQFLTENCGLRFIGQTPEASNRGQEINLWLDSVWNRDKPFVIFDDDRSISQFWFAQRWVQTYERDGLDVKHLDRAFKILKFQQDELGSLSS